MTISGMIMSRLEHIAELYNSSTFPADRHQYDKQALKLIDENAYNAAEISMYYQLWERLRN